MIEILKKFDNGTVDVVSIEEVKVGDEFMKTIVNINEQRKERGTYDDESKRRMWAKVSY